MAPQSKNTDNHAFVRIHPDSEKASGWHVDRRIFGIFFEMNGRDTYPGIIDDCIANGSFEQWHSKRKKDGSNLPWTMRTEVMYRDTPVTAGVAYPWEPMGSGGAEYRQPEGGVHGKAEWRRYQRIQPAAGAGRCGIMQRITLADERNRVYHLRFHARASGAVSQVHVALEDKTGRPLAEHTVELSEEWTRVEVKLVLDELSAYRYAQSPFGEYRLSFAAEAEGEGELDLDWVTLMSDDAVGGIYNPTTIELLRSYHVTTLRWGGNYANEYNWRDGIGPWMERPVRDNLNWGGLEPNYFGTNEFLSFCRLVGAEPLMNVAFSRDLPPEVAADWVEYVNGGRTTPMGRLRAAHGYPEPWGVKLWQVGNENYGDYQFGHTNSIDYAERIKAYYEAIKRADPSIKILVAGEDPMYVDYSEVPGQPPLWNKRMFEIAGPKYMDGMDIHQYTRGIRTDAGLREEWLKENETGPISYNQVLVAYPTQYETVLKELKALAGQYGFDSLELEIGEWNLEPEINPGWPKADYETMAHACYAASMFNTFIRQGDAVKYAYKRDNVFYYRAYAIDMRPVSPGNETSRFYAEPFLREDTRWRHLPLEMKGKTFVMPQTWVRIRRMEGIPYVDCAAVISDRLDEIILFAVNRDLQMSHDLTIAHSLAGTAPQASVLLQYADDPLFKFTDWHHRAGYHETNSSLTPNPDGQFVLSLPAGSVARIILKK